MIVVELAATARAPFVALSHRGVTAPITDMAVEDPHVEEAAGAVIEDLESRKSRLSKTSARTVSPVWCSLLCRGRQGFGRGLVGHFLLRLRTHCMKNLDLIAT